MKAKQVLSWYITQGFKVKKCYVGKKYPIDPKDEGNHTLEELIAHKGNFSITVPDGFLVIDIDCKNGKEEIATKNLQYFVDKLDLQPTVQTASGGYHIYVKVPKGNILKTHDRNFPNVDFLGAGKNVCIPPSVVKGGNYKLLRDDIREYNPDHLLKNKTQQNKVNSKIEKLKYWLSKISNDCSYSEWCKCIFAIHDYMPTDEGLEIAKEWSSKDYDKYNEKELEKIWNHTEKDKGITYKYLKLLSKSNEEEEEIYIDPKIKEVLTDWVFWETENTFFNIGLFNKSFNSERVFLTKDNFLLRFGNLIKAKNQNTKLFKFLEYIPTISGEIYKVGEEKRIIENEAGLFYLNTYKNPVYENTNPLDAESLEWIDFLKRHIKLMCGEVNFKYVFDWVVWQIKHPGVLLRWCPIIQSNFGIGKTFFDNFLKSMLGYSNVGTVPPDALHQLYNGWAASHAVVILEELRTAGSNRFETLERLKPLITNDYISIREMYKPHRTCLNSTNYFSFTNHLDFLPILNGDRRFFCIISPNKDDKEIVKRAGYEDRVDEYFQKLYAGVGKYNHAFKEYCNRYQIDNYLYDVHVAPDPLGIKRLLQNAEDLKTPYVSEILDLIAEEEDPIYINSNYIVMDKLTNKLSNLETDKVLGFKTLTHAMSKLKYLPAGRASIQGRKFSVWIASHKVQLLTKEDVVKEISQQLNAESNNPVADAYADIPF